MSYYRDSTAAESDDPFEELDFYSCPPVPGSCTGCQMIALVDITVINRSVDEAEEKQQILIVGYSHGAVQILLPKGRILYSDDLIHDIIVGMGIATDGNNQSSSIAEYQMQALQAFADGSSQNILLMAVFTPLLVEDNIATESLIRLYRIPVDQLLDMLSSSGPFDLLEYWAAEYTSAVDPIIVSRTRFMPPYPSAFLVCLSDGGLRLDAVVDDVAAGRISLEDRSSDDPLCSTVASMSMKKFFVTCHQTLAIDQWTQLDACGYQDGRLLLVQSRFVPAEGDNSSSDYQRIIIGTQQFQHIQLITALNLRLSPPAVQTANATKRLFDLVAAAGEHTLVFRQNQLASDGDAKETLKLSVDPVELEEIFDHDCVISIAWVDVDLDGADELVLGTFGKTLLVFNYKDIKDAAEQHQLSHAWERKFSSPVFALHKMHCRSDGNDGEGGAEKLVCVSRRGIHVLQRQFDVVAQRLHTAILQEQKERSETSTTSVAI